MGNISCMNPQPFNQSVPNQSQPQQSQQNSNLAPGIDFINFLQQRVQSKFFVQFKPQKGIQQYVGIPLQNLSQLYNFVKTIKNYDMDFDNLSQKSKKSVQSDIKKDCQIIIDEVKLTLFDLKKNTKRNVKLLKVNDSVNEKNHINIPFYLPWISTPNGQVCIYIGQWQYESNYFEKNFPSGIGRLYLGRQIWQGQIQCSLQKFQQKDIGEIESIKQRINNESTPIKQKILLLKNNCIFNLQGLGRKFTKDEEYCGHFQKGSLNGKGQYKNHSLQYNYEGMWVNGLKEGKGIQKTKLTLYEGSFRKNKKNGQGTLIFYISTQQQRQRLNQQKQFDESLPDLPQYKQRKKRVKIELNLQQKSDQIIQKILNSHITNYKGEQLLMISNKSYNLQSVQQFPFINQDFIQNLKFEQSTKTNFLEKYLGNFINDQFHGKGVYQWSKGNFYVGDWVVGKMQGQGKFYWKQGYYYYGEYKNDLKHGKGEMKWDPYKRHRGNWAFGKKHGYGEQIKIQIRQDTLGVSIKSGLWKNNLLNQRDIYFQKFFPFPDNSLQTTLFLSNIEFYYSKLKLSPQLKKKLFDEKSKKFYKNPCEICGSYFLKIQEEQNEENIWKINLNKKDDDEIQPQLCRQCQKKIQNNNKVNLQKKKENQKTISGWFQD